MKWQREKLLPPRSCSRAQSPSDAYWHLRHPAGVYRDKRLYEFDSKPMAISELAETLITHNIYLRCGACGAASGNPSSMTKLTSSHSQFAMRPVPESQYRTWAQHHWRSLEPGASITLLCAASRVSDPCWAPGILIDSEFPCAGHPLCAAHMHRSGTTAGLN